MDGKVQLAVRAIKMIREVRLIKQRATQQHLATSALPNLARTHIRTARQANRVTDILILQPLLTAQLAITTYQPKLALHTDGNHRNAVTVMIKPSTQVLRLDLQQQHAMTVRLKLAVHMVGKIHNAAMGMIRPRTQVPKPAQQQKPVMSAQPKHALHMVGKHHRIALPVITKSHIRIPRRVQQQKLVMNVWPKLARTTAIIHTILVPAKHVPSRHARPHLKNRAAATLHATRHQAVIAKRAVRILIAAAQQPSPATVGLMIQTIM